MTVTLILSSLLLVGIFGSKEKSLKIKCINNAKNANIALLQYALDHEKYPQQLVRISPYIGDDTSISMGIGFLYADEDKQINTETPPRVTDGDGTPDYEDDPVEETVELPRDTAGDGTPDYQDEDPYVYLDSDEDEQINTETPPRVTDGDGTPDYQDVNQDGIQDTDESGQLNGNMPPINTDGGGIPDYQSDNSSGSAITISPKQGVFQCPKVIDPNAVSYGLNENVRGLNLGMVRNSSHIITIIESDQEIVSSVNSVNPRHSHFAVIGFMDGHIESVKLADLTNSSEGGVLYYTE